MKTLLKQSGCDVTAEMCGLSKKDFDALGVNESLTLDLFHLALQTTIDDFYKVCCIFYVAECRGFSWENRDLKDTFQMNVMRRVAEGSLLRELGQEIGSGAYGCKSNGTRMCRMTVTEQKRLLRSGCKVEVVVPDAKGGVTTRKMDLRELQRGERFNQVIGRDGVIQNVAQQRTYIENQARNKPLPKADEPAYHIRGQGKASKCVVTRRTEFSKKQILAILDEML